MEKIAIIAEYNPFHKGHRHQIEEIRKNHPNVALIAIMSGNAVQRGEFAITDKFTRTETALKQGIDVVVELPVYYSVNGANEFAMGALEIINYFKISTICFGSESNNKQFLETASDKVNANLIELKKLVKKTNSYPKSIEQLIGKKLAANDILALCYLKEIKLANYKINYLLIKRNNDQYQTASKIRNEITQGKKVDDNLTKINNPIIMDDYSDLIIGKIISTKTDDPTIKYLQNIIKNNNITKFSTLVNEAANNSLTQATIRRKILRWTLEISNTSYLVPRILGVTKKGQTILKEWKKEGLSFNTKISKHYQNEINLANFIELKHQGTKQKELSSLIIKEKDEF